MKASITITTNVQDMINALGKDYAAGLVAGTTTVCETAAALIQPETPVVTSNLVNSMTTEVSEDGRRGVLRWLADYGRYIIEGTGLYGPKGEKITPKNKKALYWSGAAHPYRSVKGIKPNDFIKRGVEKLDAQAAFEKGMGGYLKSKGWTK